MHYLLTIILLTLCLHAKTTDFSIVIDEPFNNALLGVTEDYDRSISAVGFIKTYKNNSSKSDATYTNAFDYENSDFKPLRSNPNMPGVIKRLILRRPNNGFPPIFKIIEKSSDLFLSEEAKDSLLENDIKGCVFTPIDVNY